MALTPPPPAPSTSDPATFVVRADAHLAWQALNVTELAALQLDVAAKQGTASAAAATATAKELLTDGDATATAADRVQTGLDRTQTGADRTAAAASAVQASKLNLGNKTSAPTLDNQGAALLAGATYYDTTLNKWRVWTGAAWGDGISTVAGVTSVNGMTGVVTGIATIGSNTFTSAQNLPTGTAIASAATVNLNTATGNRVHITGTTTITAVTLTRGPRTVIFDGILTLTHHATNNNLPGATNIVTAAGDRAIYESDGVTVYCVSYIKASGVAVVAVSTSVGDHCVWLHTGNGKGSASTLIRRFTTTLVNTGTAISYTDSATLGAVLTINEAGLYAFTYQDGGGLSSAMKYGVSINSAELTTNIEDILPATRIGIGTATTFTTASGAYGPVISGVLRLAPGNVLRAHTGSGTSSDSALVFFIVRKVGV